MYSCVEVQPRLSSSCPTVCRASLELRCSHFQFLFTISWYLCVTQTSFCTRAINDTWQPKDRERDRKWRPIGWVPVLLIASCTNADKSLTLSVCSSVKWNSLFLLPISQDYYEVKKKNKPRSYLLKLYKIFMIIERKNITLEEFQFIKCHRYGKCNKIGEVRGPIHF